MQHGLSEIGTQILDELKDDLIHHGWLVQGIELMENVRPCSSQRLQQVLTELLETKKVQIGNANRTQLAGKDYVEFVAWKGSEQERIQRALAVVAAAGGHDVLFAYWLCLNENVDRFEEEQADGN
ncbi:MAG: hypothetical protein SGJ19_14365 [Planctomycetia bacterium]|nr:hypothetical protein [Planctomycetia bacterium]